MVIKEEGQSNSKMFLVRKGYLVSLETAQPSPASGREQDTETILLTGRPVLPG